jgi:predicted AlkP superfamily pyrophosphatase or phosphodiesterase
MLTGKRSGQHGIVGNGWFDRSLQEVHFWKQSNHLVHGPMVWDTLRERANAAGRNAPVIANSFWWFNMYSGADISVTPRPQYRADGRKVPDCWTQPPELRDELQEEHGQFPLFHFWGPMSDIRSTDWIACAAMSVEKKFQPDLHLIYLPHLDYCLQKFGPEDPRIDQEIREIDRVFEGIRKFYEQRGVQVVVLSEYGIAPVDHALTPNRTLRDAGFLAIRNEGEREYLDAGSSRAFAVCDHQVAHVYVKDASDIPAVRAALLAGETGIEQLLDSAAQQALGIQHERSGDLLAVAAAGAWFAYPWWNNPRSAPDFARTVDIHRKPGYDPLELFMDPSITAPTAYVARQLLLRKLGMRALLETVPLDTSLIRGSHGRVESGTPYAPVLIADGLDMLDAGSVHATQVHDALVHLVERA